MDSLHPYRTHTCGALRKADVGKRARISGWAHRVRDHGGLLFIDLRDHYGVTQCVIEPDAPAFKAASEARSEWVLTLTGPVVARSPDTVNKDLPSGEVEIRIEEVKIISRADELPLPVFGDAEYPEETRLRYRFIDLRREKLHRHITLRSKIIESIRKRMITQGFTEFQTPILTASSPEGARDFLVPSRLHPGKFYALPQAPQQFKQLIMVAGFDRYFQIAPCFRDEDARADRSPGEFYQLDFEMSFVTQEDVFLAIEPVLHGLFTEFAAGRKVSPLPFKRIAYDESLLKYGTDKPDLRNPIVITDVTDVFARDDVNLNIFKGMTVRAIPAPGAANQPRSWFDKMNEWARGEGAKGLGYITFEENPNSPEPTLVGELLRSIAAVTGDQNAAKKTIDVESANPKGFMHSLGKGPLVKSISPEAIAFLMYKTRCKAGDAVFFSADKNSDGAATLAGLARNRIGNELNVSKKDCFEFCWTVDFPMYEWNDQDKKIDFSHNPFSMPNFDREKFLKLNLNDKDTILGIKAFQYDIVCNGTELSSGAIRNHDPEVMLKAFEIAGYKHEETEARFGGMLNAFRYGAPPHGGSAPGIDRMVMLLAGVENLREVTMFPMNQQAQDLMMGAPSDVSAKQLRELHIRVVRPEKPEK